LNEPTTQPTSPTATDVTLVTEAYNVAEGQSEASFLRAVGEVERLARRNSNVTIVVLDPTPANVAAPLLARHHPDIQTLHLPGQTYDGQKNTAARQAKSKFVVFLDGDCKPRRDDWLEQLLAPFADPGVPAVCGLTLYEDFSVTGKAMTILDFGFLFEPAGSALGCYVSNNIAFRRESLLVLPIPDEGFMRCHCYKHAQLMQRAGKALRFQPRAFVLHELPDIEKERRRRGYDYVSTLWADPELAETAWLEPTEAFIARVLEQNLQFALTRLKKAPPELEITAAEAGQIEREIRRLIQLDQPGIRDALAEGEANSLNRLAREIHQHKQAQKAPPPKRR
jgi:Glycosyl transferase family 2